MGEYLIDNNVISGYFSGLLSAKAMDLISDAIDKTPNLSVITEIEALSWISQDKGKENIIATFVSEANILALTSDIVAECVKIRRSRRIRTPDAIIAATAIVHSLSLLSSDEHFKSIPGLKVINPSEMA